MKVTLKLFATLGARLPPEARRAGRLELDVAPGTTVQALIDQFRLPPELCSLVLVNGRFAAAGLRKEQRLEADDVLAIWPPVGGG
jgi:sulfur carrier protein ThiS